MWSSDWHSPLFLECFSKIPMQAGWYGALTLLLIVAGIQDWRTRDVSNWITIPLFAAGLMACAWRIITDPFNGIAIAIMIVLLSAVIWKKDWMGGADWKVLIGLVGLWPLAGFISIIVAGFWGVVAIVQTRNPRVRFPAVSAFAAAAVLTLLITL